jgi:hypothetical protein
MIIPLVSELYRDFPLGLGELIGTREQLGDDALARGPAPPSGEMLPISSTATLDIPSLVSRDDGSNLMRGLWYFAHGEQWVSVTDSGVSTDFATEGPS